MRPTLGRAVRASPGPAAAGEGAGGALGPRGPAGRGIPPLSVKVTLSKVTPQPVPLWLPALPQGAGGGSGGLPRPSTRRNPSAATARRSRLIAAMPDTGRGGGATARLVPRGAKPRHRHLGTGHVL